MKKIQLSQGKFAKVDDEDFSRVSSARWCATFRDWIWYANTNVKKKNGKRSVIQMHRFIDSTPKGVYVDHINGDGLDNRKKNLRRCTNRQNLANRRKRTVGASKYIGVRPSGKRWVAKIGANYKMIHLGTFDTEIEAARARDRKARELYGEFARLNLL